MQTVEGDHLTFMSLALTIIDYVVYVVVCINPRLTKLFFVTLLTKGGCYNP